MGHGSSALHSGSAWPRERSGVPSPSSGPDLPRAALPAFSFRGLGLARLVARDPLGANRSGLTRHSLIGSGQPGGEEGWGRRVGREGRGGAGPMDGRGGEGQRGRAGPRRLDSAPVQAALDPALRPFHPPDRVDVDRHWRGTDEARAHPQSRSRLGPAAWRLASLLQLGPP